MTEKLILIHGWSDCSQSFSGLKASLSDIFQPSDIYFLDYESREDNMSFDDVTDGFRDRLIEKKLIGPDNLSPDGSRLNVIVHSTGGLVVRDFISRYYSDNLDKCPIKRIVMLAPANFGSPLAHMGKSAIGSFAAGRKEIGNFFETGRQILTGLELASPYQWLLAERDVVHEKQFYSASKIQVTVLVGHGQYDGLKQVANKPGTDGTVVIAGANLDTVRFTFNFSKGEYDFDRLQTISETAFRVFESPNHSTIVDEAAKKNSDVHNTIREALSTKDIDGSDFLALRTRLNQETAAVYTTQGRIQYQQFIVRVTDDFGKPVTDYRLEFLVSTADELKTPKPNKKEGSKSLLGLLDFTKISDPLKRLSDDVSADICDQFYQHSIDKSYRRFLVDLGKVHAALDDAKKQLGKDVLLAIKLHLPKVDRGISYCLTGLENIVVYDPSNQTPNQPKIFYPNTTTLLEFKVNRMNSYVYVDTNPSTQKARETRYINSVKAAWS